MVDRYTVKPKVDPVFEEIQRKVLGKKKKSSMRADQAKKVVNGVNLIYPMDRYYDS